MYQDWAEMLVTLDKFIKMRLADRDTPEKVLRTGYLIKLKKFHSHVMKSNLPRCEKKALYAAIGRRQKRALISY